ncbi:transporter substrate-binding domain-containing protein [Pelomonas cellulosilytica]|uniref:Transporter substrate-binding domain-containing protein n=1 Tax=Pelomonas cellulosilytica TaxID=2906762 RepID=A0ABS8XWT9_9BURK|nr:transporter substrate-binding domain-containing protein [Pelomonas sp. P8]MCE4555194.1 transporter substrate-binding domain-containing protein [Pelomonas sp. P8]
MPTFPPFLRRRDLLTLPCLLAGQPGTAAEPNVVRMPRHVSMPDPQLAYVRRIIELALRRSGVRREIRFVNLDMTQGRTLVELATGSSPVDLMWTMTDRQRESGGLLPVRIPIDRGLLGWRLLLVRRAELDAWAQVAGLEELRGRLAGQGHDWPDTTILRANGLQVGTSSDYDALFRMLAAGRIDYFPRSILEIDAEVARNLHPELAIAPDLMLHYPAAAYLFVGPHRPQLAADLLGGLEAAVTDGSFQRLHREFYGAVLNAHPVSPGRVIKLRNPLLPPETPLKRRELWLQPGEAP